MFDIFKQDIKIGDKVKLYLTTGKEPEGTVIQIGENYVLLKSIDNTQNRFFDKLIGGWDVIQSTNSDSLDIEITKKQETIEIDKNYIIENSFLLLSSESKLILEKRIEPNANIIEVGVTNCIASNNTDHSICIYNNKIADDKLISELKTFQYGSIIPVVLSLTLKQDKKNVNAVALPNILEEYIKSFIQLVTDAKYTQASVLLYIIKDRIKHNKYLGYIINEIKKIYIKNESNEIKKNEPIEIKKDEGAIDDNLSNKRLFKNVEIEINNLIRQSKFEFALSKIDKELSLSIIEDKYKSSLLLKKAQIFSSLNDPDSSEKAYLELVTFNEKIKSPPNNLSHLLTELARLQALKADKQILALESVKKALKYNPNNNFAFNLLKQFEGKTDNTEFIINKFQNLDEHFFIEAEEDTGAISKMIDLDINEHKYSNPEVIRNGGKPTAFIAKKIFEEAKKTKNVDLSERYPIYLEAAKAFSELNIGSYDLRDYLESVAYYSMLKGNSLFINFRDRIFNNEIDIISLTRLRDSACSYYIESLNLLSNIEPKLLLSILANYLKINIVLFYINNNPQPDYKYLFKGQFADVLLFCLKNDNEEIEKIAYKTIVDCGGSSINAWNRLYSEPKGAGALFSTHKRSQDIFELINKIEDNDLSTMLRPGEFIKATFLERRKKVNEFNISLSRLLNIPIEPHNIEIIITYWKQISNFEKYLTPTDIETKRELDNELSILQPYLNRNQSERTNILIQARNIIEKQIIFINDNTTFYGRTFFYGLLNKWKREIDHLIEEKITQSYPSLVISIDPPYYIETNGEITAPLIIKNDGEATTEGFLLNITCESTKYEEKVEIPFESEVEIAADSKIEISFVIPPHLLTESKAVEISIDIQAVYLKKKLASKTFEFTIEEEPKSILTYEDIPWRDGPIPPEHLFKGRKKLIADLAQHYLSTEKDKPYILYGLTRTGKSSVLEYLRKDLEGDSFISKGIEKSVITFFWDLSEASSHLNASDFYNYILYQQTFEVIEAYFSKNNVLLTDLRIDEKVRFKDFKLILEYLSGKNIYPIFFVDEFSFIRTLIDKGTINSAFLHSLRQFSLTGLASFIFAGTYDIKALIKDPKYGITGQLVNAIEEQVNEINNESAEELMEVIDDKLSFTPEAVGHIKFLSGNVPYFIQIICKYCGYYASENKRRYIGYPELEKVVKILIGQEPSSSKSLVKKLPENSFQNNQFSPADPKEVAVLISSIVYFNKDRIDDPRGIGFGELQKLWADKEISAYRPKLAEAINLLKDKRIIVQEEDEGVPVYKLSVDLFRRWWENHYPDINLTLTTLIEEK
jgi:hypothetical protein